ncbi:hypothetical protein A2129_02115 [Candidatus Woesebacteria bacterium GWC1_42_13]|uniref:TrpR like protein, YerC/YecD n=2 Tax=Candidatus Woeseibacteriota TaxID=1752722 RepID=A0A1F7WU65_9BACT|nr:MAG: hypothetical protein UT23_C0023G0006 [Candidatus Woesebacteria bacterium GW2011_GWA1_39_12]OGM06352.1 MAG: hypothetical protein A2129_02115 [Candidatus Woesebacteria bacterium GWC1_42_13]
MRVSGQRLNPSLENQIVKTFAQTISDLKDINEMTTFLDDFFNQTELETFIKRLAIAYWLKKGRSWENIKQNLKVSSATIATVQTQMEKPGFALALKKLEAEEWASLWAEKIKKFIR